MTAEPIEPDHTYVDAEEWVRTWLRGHERLTPLVAGRVFFGVPTATLYPLATVSRIGGQPRGAVDSPRLSAQAWGDSKKSAADVARAIVAAVDGIGGTVDLFLWQPAAPDGKPRYIIDFSLDIAAVPVAED
jgi:hypothetical protein